MVIRYSRWDGLQEPFGLDADELMEAMSDDLLDDGDLWRALQKMFRRGAENQQGDRMRGLQDLMDQLRNRRRENLDRHNMSGILDDIKERLENVKKTEREGIEQRVQEGREKVEASKSPQPGESGESGEAGEMGQAGDPDQQAAFQKMLERMAQQKRQQLDQLPKDVPGQIKELTDYDFMD